MDNAPDWIEWAGGECPVAPDTIIQVRFRNETRGDAAKSRPQVAVDEHSEFNWKWRHNGSDIIAYRLSQAPR